LTGINVLIDTNSYGFSGQFDPALDQAEESTIAWICVASSLALILLIITGITGILGCRRLSLSALTSLPESEIEWFTDSQFSFTAPDPFLSEQNALSAGVWAE
jgi:hypothetical protein